MADWQQDLDAARQAALDAGELILQAASVGVGEVRSKSFINDLVTETDLAADKLIRSQIADLFPHDGLLTEEGDEVGGTSGRRWVIDPLDGTANFVRNLWPSAVSIGLEVDGVARLGVVYDYRHDDLYSAVAGQGCWLNGRTLQRPTDQVALKEAFITINNTSRPADMYDRLALVNKVLPSVHVVRDLGSTAMCICLVASGNFDAYVVHTVKLWDVCAGFVIAAEGGCAVTGIKAGEAPSERAAIVAAPHLVKPLQELIAG